jgi:hypothetical protein
MRVMVQETWLPLGETGSRDAATYSKLQNIHSTTEGPYRARLRNQLSGLQGKTAANFTTLVPVWDLVLTLRECTVNLNVRFPLLVLTAAAIVQGKLPGVSKQSGLFADSLGHPKQPLADAASYSTWLSDTELDERIQLISTVQFGLQPCME